MAFEFIRNFMDNIKNVQEEKEKKLQDYINNIDDNIVKSAWFWAIKWWWANFKTHTMINDNLWNIIFKAQLWFVMIFLIAFWIPIFVSISWIISDIIWWNFILDIENLSKYLWSIIISLLFWLPAWGIYFLMINSFIFDFQNWYFYNKRFQNKLYFYLNDDKYKEKIIQLKEIHALQIVSERVSWKNSSYTSYELNLILKDSRRINVIDHWNINQLRKDTEELAMKLWVKVYDITNILN